MGGDKSVAMFFLVWGTRLSPYLLGGGSKDVIIFWEGTRRVSPSHVLSSSYYHLHEDMKGTIVHDGSSSEPFDIRSGVKQGCVLAPTLFGIFFAVMLKQAFGESTEGIYLHTRLDGNLFNLTSLLKAKTKVEKYTVRDFLFADDEAIATHDEKSLQLLIDSFSEACHKFGLTISIKKTWDNK